MTIRKRSRKRLTGRRVLLAEDEFYQAADIAYAFRHAGAQVVGPYESQERALAELDDHPALDCAVVDLLLSDGTPFELARRLSDQKVPFVFLTGADPKLIPAEFAEVPVFLKPADLGLVVLTLTRSLHPSDPQPIAKRASGF